MPFAISAAVSYAPLSAVSVSLGHAERVDLGSAGEGGWNIQVM